MLLPVLLILFTISIGASHIIWTTSDIKPLDNGLRKISLSLSQDTGNNNANLTQICLMDKISFEWKILDDLNLKDNLNVDNVSIAVVDSTGSRMFLVPLGAATSIVSSDDQLVTPESESADQLHSTISQYSIQCEIPNANCIPAIQTVTSFAEKGRLTMKFDQPTNMPALESTFAIRSALDITPRIIGGAIGEWTSADTLELAVSQQYITALNNAYLNGELVSISARRVATFAGSELQPDANTDKSNGNANAFDYRSGVIKIRFREHGLLAVAAVDHNSMQLLSSYCKIKISLCDEDVNIMPLFVQRDNLTLHSQSDSLRFKRVDSGRAFYMKGLFAVSGTTPVVVAHESIPAMQTGIWSVSCWFRLLQGPTGSFRTIFFKGDRLGRNAERTPSVWLLPDRNRFTIRVSTSSTPDLGAETTLDIPLHEWTFLTFVFQKDSGTLISSSSVYVNGLLDVRIQYGEAVSVNSGPLQFFKDVSHSGPRAMVQDLCVWDRALIESDVLALYSKGFLRTPSPGHGRTAGSTVAATERVLQVLTESRSSLIASPPAATSAVKKSAIAGNAEPQQMEVEGQIEADTDSDPEIVEDVFAVDSRSNRLRQSVEMIQKWKDNGGESDCSESGWRQRVDIFAEAAVLGNAEALLNWAMLRIYGYTQPQSSCGASMVRVISQDEVDEEVNTLALIFAVDMGESKALGPLALRLLTGVGTRSLWADQSDINTSHARQILPLPKDKRHCKFYHTLRRAVRQSFGKAKALAVARSALDYITYAPSSSDTQILISCPLSSALVDDRDRDDLAVTDLALGLLHVAAMFADSEAAAILAHKYQHGLMLEEDIETAAQYASIAAEVASTEFHRVGGQPVLESDRINDDTAPQVATGNKGDQDELIQHQIVRAKEGDVGAMLAMGDLFYYGARGMPRDQAQALQYFQQAASLGNTEGLCGAAGMLLKGEGTPGNQPNVTAAVQLYEEAAAKGAVRALNGLGYIYFYGQGLEKNSSRAYQYFLEAAEAQPSDGDALFNTAVCLHHGIGIETNLERAVGYYTLAAQKFGHFGSIKAMGTMLLEGEGVIARNSAAALPYLSATVQIGPWVGWLRRGLDLYLAGQFRRSANCYLHAGEIGYEVSVSNAAYVLKNKIPRLNNPNPNPNPISKVNSEKRLASNGIDTDGFLLLRELLLSASQGNADSMVEIGHCYLTGATSCGVGVDMDQAIAWYSKAGTKGQPIASIYMGFIHHFGLGVKVNIPRAERYYKSALQNQNLKSAYVRTAVQSLLYLLPYADSYAVMPLNVVIKHFMQSSFM